MEIRQIKNIDFPHCIPTKQKEMKFEKGIFWPFGSQTYSYTQDKKNYFFFEKIKKNIEKKQGFHEKVGPI